mmetsp:Transcript_24055/g.69445  ORF Transcript_24055/g.69445 Transcript_24055/m.69445 type:complete len:296 (-) Transcript_24055:211-1098(-)
MFPALPRRWRWIGGRPWRPSPWSIHSEHCCRMSWNASNLGLALSSGLVLIESRQTLHWSQSCVKSTCKCSTGAIMTVVPESGMAPQGDFWPGLRKPFLQKSAGEEMSPTEMPRKSRPQWTSPIEPRGAAASGVPSLRTPSLASLKHMLKRETPARSRKPLGAKTISSSGFAGRPPRGGSPGSSGGGKGDLAAGGPGGPGLCCRGLGLGRPRPRMPSKGPSRRSAWSTISSRPSSIAVWTEPTLTTSEEMTASMLPLPKAISTTGTWPSAPIFLMLKLEDFAVPWKHLLSALQWPL